MPLRVLLADDHALVRQGLRALLEREHMAVVAEADNGADAIRLAEKHKPDVAVLDYSMPGCNGLSAVETIRKKCPDTASIILTVHPEEHRVLAALQAGARGYVLKTGIADDLIRAVKQVAQGRVYLSAGVMEVVADAISCDKKRTAPKLTARERQVLQLVAEGKTIKESAMLLKVSVKTAESYRAKLMAKLNIHTTAGLVRYAIREGVIDA